jgi:hypothetical protein
VEKLEYVKVVHSGRLTLVLFTTKTGERYKRVISTLHYKDIEPSVYVIVGYSQWKSVANYMNSLSESDDRSTSDDISYIEKSSLNLFSDEIEIITKSIGRMGDNMQYLSLSDGCTELWKKIVEEMLKKEELLDQLVKMRLDRYQNY